MSAAISRGRIGECSPRTSRVGRGDAVEQRPAVGGTPPAVAGRIEAVEEPALALGDARARQMLEQPRVGDRLARQETEALERGLERLVAHRPAVAASVHVLEALGRDGRAAVHHDQPLDTLRVPGRERHRVVAAHGVADHGHPAPAEGVHHSDQVAGEVLGGVGGLGRPLAGSVAALVERDHVVAIDEGGHDGVEPVRVRGAAVQEAERRPAGLAPLEGVESQAVYLEGARPGDLATEGGRGRSCAALYSGGARL